MAYKLEIKRTAQRSLARLAKTAARDLQRIETVIDGLSQDPRPRGAVKIRARPPVWRIRVGIYRVVYAVFDSEQLVIIGKVERRAKRTYADIGQLF